MVLCLEGPEGHFNPGTMKGGMVVDFPPFTSLQGPHMLGKRSARSYLSSSISDLCVSPSKTIHPMVNNQKGQMTRAWFRTTVRLRKRLS